MALMCCLWFPMWILWNAGVLADQGARAGTCHTPAAPSHSMGGNHSLSAQGTVEVAVVEANCLLSTFAGHSPMRWYCLRLRKLESQEARKILLLEGGPSTAAAKQHGAFDSDKYPILKGLCVSLDRLQKGKKVSAVHIPGDEQHRRWNTANQEFTNILFLYRTHEQLICEE